MEIQCFMCVFFQTENQERNERKLLEHTYRIKEIEGILF